MSTFIFFSIRNACLFSNFPMLLAGDMLITNQDAPSTFLKTPQGGVGDLNSGPLEEQSMLLTTEPSL